MSETEPGSSNNKMLYVLLGLIAAVVLVFFVSVSLMTGNNGDSLVDNEDAPVRKSVLEENFIRVVELQCLADGEDGGVDGIAKEDCMEWGECISEGIVSGLSEEDVEMLNGLIEEKHRELDQMLYGYYIGRKGDIGVIQGCLREMGVSFN